LSVVDMKLCQMTNGSILSDLNSTMNKEWVEAVQQQFTPEDGRPHLIFTFPRLSQSFVAYDSVRRVQTVLEVYHRLISLSELLYHVFTKVTAMEKGMQ